MHGGRYDNFTGSSARLPESHTLQLAVAGYLARFKGLSRTHAESDLRAYLRCCADRRLDPLAAARPRAELYVAQADSGSIGSTHWARQAGGSQGSPK